MTLFLKPLIRSVMLASILGTPVILCAAEYRSEVSINKASDMVIIRGNGETRSNIIEQLSKQAGFTVSGNLENRDEIIDYKIKDKTLSVIEHLVKPQSVIIMKKTDDAGTKHISSIELLPTGNEDSDYLPRSAPTIYKVRKPSGDPAADERHRLKDLRRAERHARGLGRINQPDFGIVTKEEALQARQLQQSQ